MIQQTDYSGMEIRDYTTVDREVLGKPCPSQGGSTIFLLGALHRRILCRHGLRDSISFLSGDGVTGLMHPVMWGIYLICFVFWIGIAHSGNPDLRHPVSLQGKMALPL